MINMNFYKKLVAVLITTSFVLPAILTPLNTNAQTLGGIPETEFLQGLPDKDPRIIEDVSQMGSGDLFSAAGSCVSDMLTNSLLSKAGSAIIGGLGSSALGGFLGSVTGGSGGFTGGDLGSISGLLGGFGGGFGIGGGTVPVNEDALRSINRGIKEDTSLQVSKEVGDGSVSLDSIMFCLANKAIEGILVGTIDWVNRGFDGNPAFIDDPGRYFGSLADYELAQILDELSGGVLCSNLRGPVRRSVLTNYASRTSRAVPKCTLDKIEGNVESFLSGDFDAGGGWDAWYTYTQYPQNNYYGSQTIVQQNLDRRIRESQNLAETELSWNNGYKSIRDPLTGEITTPGNLTQAQVENRINAPINRLTFADEFDEIMNNLINGFVKNSIGELMPGPDG